jgi:hypothetical protein
MGARHPQPALALKEHLWAARTAHSPRRVFRTLVPVSDRYDDATVECVIKWFAARGWTIFYQRHGRPKSTLEMLVMLPPKKHVAFDKILEEVLEF